MPLVKHVSGDFYCYVEDAGKGAWAYGPLHHSEIPATAADAMEILEAQDRERMEEDGAWLYDEIVANRAFGVDYPAPEEQSTGREPIITDERPAFEYIEPVTGRTITYTVGFITDEYIPCMALFVGDSNTPILIPVSIMVHAIDIGAEQEDSDGEEGHCTECGVTYADIVEEVGDVYPEARDGEDFFCVECQWEEEHDTSDENCKCHPRQAQATEEVTT